MTVLKKDLPSVNYLYQGMVGAKNTAYWILPIRYWIQKI